MDRQTADTRQPHEREADEERASDDPGLVYQGEGEWRREEPESASLSVFDRHAANDDPYAEAHGHDRD